MSHFRSTREAGALIRRLRREQRLTQTELAQRLGTTQDRIVRLEQGNPRIQATVVLDAFAALGMRVLTEPAPPESDDDPFLGLFGEES